MVIILHSLCVRQEQEQLSYSSTRTKVPSTIVTGLKPSTVYVFHIRARTATGYSSYSSKLEFTTGDDGGRISAPSRLLL